MSESNEGPTSLVLSEGNISTLPFSMFIAKITRCGHIYCWSCILHYLSLVSEDLLILGSRLCLIFKEDLIICLECWRDK